MNFKEAKGDIKLCGMNWRVNCDFSQTFYRTDSLFLVLVTIWETLGFWVFFCYFNCCWGTGYVYTIQL